MFRGEFQVLKKMYFESNSVAVTLRLLIQAARPHLNNEDCI